MDTSNEHYILKINCPAASGIVAAITTCLAHTSPNFCATMRAAAPRNGRPSAVAADDGAAAAGPDAAVTGAAAGGASDALPH